MSKPNDTTEDLFKTIGDPDTKRAVQGLLRRIEGLEEELAKRDDALRSSYGFLKSTFRASFNDYCHSASGAVVQSSDSSPTSAGPLGDREALIAARAHDDFLEVCRLAFKIVEATTLTVFEAVRAMDPKVAETAWDRQQEMLVGRDATRGKRLTPQPLAADLKRLRFGYLLEAAFLMIYGPQFERAGSERDRYFLILTIQAVRHIPSHGQSAKQAEVLAALGQIKWRQRREEAEKLYRTRGQDGYDRLVGAVGQYATDATAFAEDAMAPEEPVTPDPSAS